MTITETDMTTIKLRIADGNGGHSETAETLAEAVDIVADWYDYMADDERYEGIDLPSFNPRGDEITSTAKLNRLIDEWEAEIAEACGHKDFHGHGNYSVSAASEMGLSLCVREE